MRGTWLRRAPSLCEPLKAVDIQLALKACHFHVRKIGVLCEQMFSLRGGVSGRAHRRGECEVECGGFHVTSPHVEAKRDLARSLASASPLLPRLQRRATHRRGEAFPAARAPPESERRRARERGAFLPKRVVVGLRVLFARLSLFRQGRRQDIKSGAKNPAGNTF